MASKADTAVQWLLAGDPAVAALARRDLFGEPVPADSALESPVVQALMADLAEESTVRRPYRKWGGAHWRLVSLVELGVPPDDEPATTACERVLDYWAGQRRLTSVPVVEGRARRCASQEGNAVAVACRLGLAHHERVRTLVEHLLACQWPDGGWNCDRRPEATHSSVHETLPALWGLHEYAAATNDDAASDGAAAAAELLLHHEVIFSARTGAPIHPSFAEPHYPPYWHFDVLQALLALHRAGYGGDRRTDRARACVAARRRPDGTWHAVRRWWRAPGARAVDEVVDWGEVAHQMVTLNALRVRAE